MADEVDDEQPDSVSSSECLTEINVKHRLVFLLSIVASCIKQ